MSTRDVLIRAFPEMQFALRRLLDGEITIGTHGLCRFLSGSYYCSFCDHDHDDVVDAAYILFTGILDSDYLPGGHGFTPCRRAVAEYLVTLDANTCFCEHAGDDGVSVFIKEHADELRRIIGEYK